MDRGEVVFCGSKGDFFRNFGKIRSGVLVLPEIYELAQILRDEGLGPIPEVFTVQDLVNAVRPRLTGAVEVR
jgi:hypothetical protein